MKYKMSDYIVITATVSCKLLYRDYEWQREQYNNKNIKLDSDTMHIGLDKLAREVNEKIKENYVPNGSHVITRFEVDDCRSYTLSQSMCRKSK
jgi:hypothetical protein